MVGRGGRSKGCKTCRRRHLKCDGSKPACQRCGQDGFRCEGYAPMQFISHDFTLDNTEVRALNSKPRDPRDGALVPRADGGTFISYLRWMLYPRSPDADEWVGFSATNQSDTLPGKCLLSLSMSFYGQSRGAPKIARQGLELYASCLKSVNNSLGVPERQLTNDVLLSILVLENYEMLLLTSATGWIHHALGMAALFEARGPSAWSDELALDLFRNCRFSIILASLAISRSTFLSQPAWKEEPWLARQTTKNSMDRLLDILSDLPGLQSRPHHDGLHNAPKLEMPNVAQDALAILNLLEEWKTRWGPEVHMGLKGEGSWGENFPESSDAVLNFGSLYDADCLLLYNAAVVYTIRTMLLSTDTRGLKPGDASVFFETARNAAVAICRSIDFLLQHSHGKIGEFLVLWPARMAWLMLGKGSTPEGRWLELRIQQMMEPKGTWGVARQALTYRTPAEDDADST